MKTNTVTIMREPYLARPEPREPQLQGSTMFTMSQGADRICTFASLARPWFLLNRQGRQVVGAWLLGQRVNGPYAPVGVE